MGQLSSESTGSVLLAVHWEKRGEEAEISIGNKIFNFLRGPGVKFRWNKKNPVEVNICGKDSLLRGDPIKEGVRTWREVLKDKSLIDVELKEAQNYPPFTDLNFHCIQIVDNYLLEQDPRYIIRGITISIPSFGSGEIVDGDIFLFGREWVKEGGLLDFDLTKLTRHEFGHFLGLDHQFKIPSIMSYNKQDIYLTKYDYDAIEELYSEPPPAPAKPTEKDQLALTKRSGSQSPEFSLFKAAQDNFLREGGH
ncbi:MAG: matrixin family metalloprotease [Bdellovibrionales bacterium]|nr:matrixin family metalloprotease [Bdellovibrionales bacterium]